MFGDAAAYERFMGRWSARLAPGFLDVALGAAVPKAACDVGCGTGNLTAELLRRHPGCVVTAVDPAPGFVEAARDRLVDAGARVVVGSVAALPLADDDVDATLALLVLNFVPDPGAALVEMVRVTRPGGVVGAAVWDYGGGMAMLRTFWDAAAAVHPEAAAVDPALARTAQAGGIEELFGAAGLDRVEGGLLEVPMRFPTFDDYWNPFLGGAGPAGDYVAGLGEGERVAVRAELERRLGPGPVEMTSTALWVRGTVGD